MNKELLSKINLFARQVDGYQILEVSYVLSIDVFVSIIFLILMFLLLTMDTEKAFDLLNHYFLCAVLKKIGFATNFINWIEAILNQNLF